MLRIRRIFNPYNKANIRKIERIKEIIQIQFPGISQKKINKLESELLDPIKHKYQSMLFVAEDINDAIRGFAILLYMPDHKLCYLDLIAVSPEKASSGLGGAIYTRVREEAELLNANGLFFECLPDDPALCKDGDILLQNQKRLAFYESFGARPIANTLYEMKVNPEDDCPPYLVYDGLNKFDTLPAKTLKGIIKAILERKYGDYCPESYIKMVVNSVKDNPFLLRQPKYVKSRKISSINKNIKEKNKILLIVNNKHAIHHIKERGYVESPVRVESIQRELDKTGFFHQDNALEYPERFILKVHDRDYVNYFKKVCKNLSKGKSVYPYVFPIRNGTKAPKELSVRAGYYCFDTFTPLNQNAFLAARWGVNCTLTATDAIIGGRKIAYVLTRPPGHHAERSVFGGFCYFNNCAIAAQRFSEIGKVAILDIDFHHGNGQQQIFYERSDVLTISIHGHPSFAYPYFSGFAEEAGEGDGHLFNFNFPLPEKTTYEAYTKILIKSLKLIRNYKPDFLIIAFGLDTAKGDPTGTWNFSFENFMSTGKLIGGLKIPTLIVQEGGYKNQSLGSNARAFFSGFYTANN
ncbi:MAG: histone deacetylase [Bacteroidetes bacterium GWF2_33_16]|nr:MAG: histone deacetylase [Bacteroidetes bacterium GWE2_32_14]OFY05906.1 MAG: histone deacetylase [Bacteroidetes bacterium GWF2_33_16]